MLSVTIDKVQLLTCYYSAHQQIELLGDTFRRNVKIHVIYFFWLQWNNQRFNLSVLLSQRLVYLSCGSSKEIGNSLWTFPRQSTIASSNLRNQPVMPIQSRNVQLFIIRINKTFFSCYYHHNCLVIRNWINTEGTSVLARDNDPAISIRMNWWDWTSFFWYWFSYLLKNRQGDHHFQQPGNKISGALFEIAEMKWTTYHVDVRLRSETVRWCAPKIDFICNILLSSYSEQVLYIFFLQGYWNGIGKKDRRCQGGDQFYIFTLFWV